MGQTGWRTAKSKSGLDYKIQFNGVGELRTLTLAPQGRLGWSILSTGLTFFAGKQALWVPVSNARASPEGQCFYIKSPFALACYPHEGILFDCASHRAKNCHAVRTNPLPMAQKNKFRRREFDLDDEALAALEEARAMQHGPERTQALKRAGILRNAADSHGIVFAKRGRPPKT